MIAPRGTSFMELDQAASTQGAPYGIITADCSDPHEIDDGLCVEALPSGSEAFRKAIHLY